MRATSQSVFKYIVVGAGSAGCVVANRLSASPENSVLLLEAGGNDRYPLISAPLASMLVAVNPRFVWHYETAPEPHLYDRRLSVPRGKLLGGTSSINAMTYTRGQRADYDNWSSFGATGWSYAEVLPYFRKAESNWRGNTPFHGGEGPLTVSKGWEDPVFFQPLMESVNALGLGIKHDMQSSDESGFSPVEYTIGRGRRASASSQYLRPIASRSNLSVVTGAHVTRVLLDGQRATGVEYQWKGQTIRALSSGEVILSGGTYNSPQLLMLSGIGPAEHLREAGIRPVHDLPGVGANLAEHVQVMLSFGARGKRTFERHLRADQLMGTFMRWALTGKGLASALPIVGWGFVRSHPGADRPDIEIIPVNAAPDASIWFPGWRKPSQPTFVLYTNLLRPRSRGCVKLRSADPFDKPVIKLNLLEHEADRSALRNGLRLMRRLAATRPLADLLAEETAPGSSVETDALLDEYMRRTAGLWHHPVGTCAIGNRPESVVDSELRVHGISGLRVIDASIAPAPISGNTNAPTNMIAEKGADAILGRSLPAWTGT